MHASKITTPDIRGGEQANIDYQGLLELNIKIALWSEPRARVIVFTDLEFAQNIEQREGVHIVRLDLNQTEPMFERVLTMASYVRSFFFVQHCFLILMLF